MADPVTTSPGYNRNAVSGPITLEELPWCGKLNIRGNPDSKDFLNNVESTLGQALPLEANTNISNGEITIYWLGPDEWLCHCDISRRDEFQSGLEKELKGVHSAVVDVSDYYTVLRLGGSRCDEVLARACPLDLHPAVFSPGRSTQTRFGEASILLHKTSETPVFDIQIRWSFTEYLWDYLVTSMDAL